MIWIIAGMLALAVLGYRLALNWLPAKGVTPVDKETLCRKMGQPGVKLLDVRDPNQYYERHLPEAINIYVGRLPFVSKKELNREDEIIIVSAKRSHLYRAARILKKSGYRGLSGYLCKAEKICAC